MIFPYDPCMEYLPTFGLNLWYMEVNMSYMDPMGMEYPTKFHASQVPLFHYH